MESGAGGRAGSLGCSTSERRNGTMPCKVTSGRTAQSFSVQSAVEGSSRSRMKASIIIATFNRGESLTLVLNGLASMVVPSDVEWEVLLVDNKSTDSTKAVI